MSSVIAQTGATETVMVGPIVDVNGNPLTGLTSVKAAIIRASDRHFLDWSTLGFAATPTTEYQALTELDSARAPGVYYLSVNTSTFTGTNADDRYFVYISQQGASNAVNALQMGELRIGTVVDKVETNLDAGIAALPAAILGSSLAGITGRTTLGGVLVWLRKMASNRLAETDGSPGTFVLYDDDSVTVLGTFNLTDISGASVSTPPGQPARRTAVTP